MKQRNVKIFFEGKDEKILRNTWSCKSIKDIIKENKEYAYVNVLEVKWIKVAGKLVYGKLVKKQEEIYDEI